MTRRSPLHWRNLIDSGRTEPSDLASLFGYHAPAVSVFDIAKRMGASLFYLPEKDGHLDGLLRIQAGEPEILINRKHHIHRQRFSVAHEIGHLLLHSETLLSGTMNSLVLYRDTSVGKNTSQVEREANRFGSRLLIPDDLIEQYSLHYGLDDLAALFQVSPEAMAIRLKGLYGI